MRVGPILFLAVVSLANGGSGPITAAQASAMCGEVPIPAPVSRLLRAKFSQWRPERVSDLDGDDRRSWSDEHQKDCPGIAVGHFESTGKLSYAVVLVPISGAHSGYRIVVFSESPTADAYKWLLLEQKYGKDQFAPAISKEAPGKYLGLDRSKSVLLKLDGINVEWIEKSSVLYYWRGGHYRRLWTSD